MLRRRYIKPQTAEQAEPTTYYRFASRFERIRSVRFVFFV